MLGASEPRPDGRSAAIEAGLRAAYGAYEYLRDHDLGAVSTTSRLLRAGDLEVLAKRARDEIEELCGTIAGTHGHGGGAADIVLETYQALYWLTVLCVAAGDRYDDVSPHRALTSPPTGEHQRLPWPPPSIDWRDTTARHDAVLGGYTAVGALCRNAGIDPLAPIQRDIAELRSKPYLEPYWAALDRQ